MPRISEESIRRVAEATDIVELIGSYFPLKRAGTTWKALCPFHNEKTPSFTVNPTRQTYRCFGCGASGTVFRFLMEYEHLEFGEAVRRLASRSGVAIIEELSSPQDEKERNQKRRLLAIHQEAAQWFHTQLTKSADADAARRYLSGRGLDLEIAKAWQLGYAPDSYDAVIEFLRDRKFSAQDISASGLVSHKNDDPSSRPYSRFRHRVMFPIRNEVGEVIAFSGRVLDAASQPAKYVNSPETPIFQKGRVLYGLDKSKRDLIKSKEAIVCEGQIDLITAFQAGVTNVIAPQGTAFTESQARILARFVETVILCFDSDKAGQAAVSRSLPSLLSAGLAVRVARLPSGQDPDSLIRTEGPQAFRDLMSSARDFFDHAVDLLIESGASVDPPRLAAACNKLAEFLADIRDPVLRELNAGRVAARLSLAPEVLLRAKPRTPSPSSPTEPQPALPAALEISPGIGILCQLSILSSAARDWLKQQSGPELRHLGPGNELLALILNADIDPDQPSSLTAFAAGLQPEFAQALHHLDLEHNPRDPEGLAKATWQGLAAFHLRSKIHALRNKIRTRSIPAEQIPLAQQQLLDLTKELKEFGGSSA